MRTRFTRMLLGMFILGGVYLVSRTWWSPSLRTIPVFIGDDTLVAPVSQPNPAGVSAIWRTRDLQITTDGHLQATIVTHFNAPTAQSSAEPFQDVLLIQVIGHYADQRHPAIFGQPLTAIRPIAAEQSSATSAQFRISTSFRPPQLTIGQSLNQARLLDVAITLTWLRIYRQNTGLAFQLFTGQPITPNQLTFDIIPTPIEGALRASAIIPEQNIVPSPVFDYLTWSQQNVRW